MRTNYSREMAYRELMLYSSQFSPLQLPEHIRVLMGAAAKILKETDPRNNQPIHPMTVREYQTNIILDTFRLQMLGWHKGEELPEIAKKEIERYMGEELKKAACAAARMEMDYVTGGIKVTVRVGLGTPDAPTLQPVTDSEWEYAFALGVHRDRKEQRWRK